MIFIYCIIIIIITLQNLTRHGNIAVFNLSSIYICRKSIVCKGEYSVHVLCYMTSLELIFCAFTHIDPEIIN